MMVLSMFCKSRAALFVLLGSFCFAGGSYYKVVNVADDDTLSIRQSASAASKKVGELQPYDTGIILNRCQKNGITTWCSIDFLPDDIMFFERDLSSMHKGAWVNKKYLKPASDILYSQALQYKENRNIFRVVGVASDDVLNVREHPRNSAKKIGELLYNDVGIVAAKCQQIAKSRWCYVAYDYTMGWASGPGSMKVPYAVLGWVNMRYLKLDNSHQKSRLPGMTFPGEAY
jgi:hypothetical protein